MSERVFVRFQAPTRNARNIFPGVFALANALAHSGVLSESEYRFWRSGNDWYNAHLTNPGTVDPTVFDRGVNPVTASWFTTAAVESLDRVAGYLDLLAAHGVACERLESTDPGRILYEDAWQVVVAPRTEVPLRTFP
ncbi:MULTISPECIES: hypothetical protein [unclassified Streptomyces]|uniref:hypothetical protein n=1 Tax=unclassified Streptomyces TaxID=2593676 RepID=UPI000CD5338D|nr:MULTISPECIES: hypothetical protein [unclassified Streptomyces]